TGDALEVERHCLRCCLNLGAGRFDLPLAELDLVVGAGDLRGNCVTNLLRRQLCLQVLAGPLALQGPVAKAEVSQFPNQQSIKVSSASDVPEGRAFPAAETTGAQAHLHGRKPRTPLLLAQAL